MQIPKQIAIKNFALFEKNHPAAAQAIEELVGGNSIEGTLVLSHEQLSKLPEHFVREMAEPKKAEALRQEAITRLETYWEKEKGLLNNQANADALLQGLRQLNQGFTPESVDRAIVILKDLGKLQWRGDKPATPAAKPQVNAAVPAQVNPAPAPAAPVAPPEPRRLDNGEPELPLNADEWTMRRASKAQLLDLSARRREGRQRPVGWVGSSF
jgi:hypothetical protein